MRFWFFFVFSSFFLHSRLAKTVPKSKRKLFSGLRRPTWSGKSRRFCLVRKNFFLGCAVSALVWKLAPYPPKVARKSFLNAPRLPWSGKSDQDLESPECRAASNLIWKMAPPLPCPENCAAINKGAKSAQQNFLPSCFKLLSHFLGVQLVLKSR